MVNKRPTARLPNLLTPVERRGFTLFMGNAACGTCHFAPLFGGDTPPLYLSSDVEVIGTAASPSRPGSSILIQ